MKQLLLTHFWPTELQERYLEEAKQIFDNVRLAEEKMVIDFDEYEHKINTGQIKI